jgi:soluble lytic murein transglycosylase
LVCIGRNRIKRIGNLALVLIVVGSGFRLWMLWRDRRERSQDVPILAAASRYGVDPALIKAVVWRESRFDPSVRGDAGEIGLMQLQDTAAREWATAERIANFDHEHCLHPGTNTLAGTWYLRKLLRRYSATDNPLPYALADYNAGRGNVLKWNKGPAATNSAAFIGQIGFPGTRAYVISVTKRYRHYQPVFKRTTPADSH